MRLSDLAVGSLVKDMSTTYNGYPIIWRVLEHGHTGDPTGSTTLETRDIITLKAFDAMEPNNDNSGRQQYGNNRYLYSNILQWLNSDSESNQWYTAQHLADQKPDSSSVYNSINPYDVEAGFLSNFSDSFKAALQEANKITVKNTITDEGGSESVSSKIFLLSTTEVGLANENSIAEGSIYLYYSNNNTNDGRKKNLANDAAKGDYSTATSPWAWWLRTPRYNSSYISRIVYTSGALNNSNAFDGRMGISPALCIPSSIKVSDTTDTDGAYLIFTPPIISKMYVSENGMAKLIYDANPPKIYGASWSGNSETTWTRTDAAERFSNPNPYYVGMSGTPSSPFDDIMPWSGMKIHNNANAGAVVSIPKFYYKLGYKTGTTGMKIQISTAQHDGFLCSPAHMDRGDGAGERDVIYVGRYHCASDYRSKTGVEPITNLSRATARSGIHNLGSTIWQWDYATLMTIWFLYLVEFADWNSQNVIGYGCSDSGSRQNNGLTDSIQYHTGTTKSARSTYGHTQYRHIEDLWGNVMDWCDGIYCNIRDVYCIKNPSNFSDNSNGTNIGIRTLYSGDVTAFNIPYVSGYEYVIYPNNTAGSSTTYICDYYNVNYQGVEWCVGGTYGRELDNGLFRLACSSGTAVPDAYIGSRLMILP